MLSHFTFRRRLKEFLLTVTLFYVNMYVGFTHPNDEWKSLHKAMLRSDGTIIVQRCFVFFLLQFVDYSDIRFFLERVQSLSGSSFSTFLCVILCVTFFFSWDRQ